MYSLYSLYSSTYAIAYVLEGKKNSGERVGEGVQAIQAIHRSLGDGRFSPSQGALLKIA